MLNKIKLGLVALLLPVMALAQSYPSPTFNNVTVNGTLTGAISGGTLTNPTITGGTITGTTGVTQGRLDNSTLLATDAFVNQQGAAAVATVPFANTTGGVFNQATLGSGAQLVFLASGGSVSSILSVAMGGTGYAVGDLLILPAGNSDALVRVTAVSSGAITTASIIYGGTGYMTGAQLPVSAIPPGRRAVVMTGTLTSNVTFIIQNGTYLTASREIEFINNTTGAFTVTVYLSNGADGHTGNGVVIPQGTNNSAAQRLYTDGVNDVWPVIGSPLPASVPLTSLATQAANTVLANVTGSTASPTAFSMPSCSTSTSALQYTSGTGFTCYTNSASLTGAFFTGSSGASYSSATFTLNDTSGTGTTGLVLESIGSKTWGLYTLNSGGSDFTLDRYVSGTFTDVPIRIANATGAVTMADGITNSPISGSTGSFTTLSASSTVSGTGFSNLIGNTTNKDIYVSTAGNDSNSGIGWGLAKLTLQAAVNAAGTNGTVHVGSGTYSLTSTLNMQPNTRLLCVDGAVITQPNAQNLTTLIDFSVNAANGASVQNCTINGNRSNNTDNASAFLLYVGPANDVTITGNLIENGNGYGIDVSTGLRPVITYNRWTNFYVGPIYVITGAGQTKTYGQIVGNTMYGAIGQHAITLNNSDWNMVSGNTVSAALQTGMTVSTSGTTVTSTGGPNFSALVPGSFIILNGGAEFLITSIASNTSLTVNSTPGTLTNVPAAAGPGDLISLLAASQNTIAQNSTTGGVGGGIVVSNFVTGESTQKNNVIENSILKTGEGCIELESENTFSTQVFDNQIRGNNIADCGVGGTAVASNTQYGIALIDFNPNTLLNTFVDGNYVRDDQGTATTANWLGLTSVGVGQVFVGKNTNVGTTNPGIAGGISSITLSGGWGTTATTSNIVSLGDAFYFQINSSGTGQSASPSVTVNTRATTSDQPPTMACQDVGGSGTSQPLIGQNPGTNSSASLQLFIYNGTPTAGQNYIILCRG